MREGRTARTLGSWRKTARKALLFVVPMAISTGPLLVVGYDVAPAIVIAGAVGLLVLGNFVLAGLVRGVEPGEPLIVSWQRYAFTLFHLTSSFLGIQLCLFFWMDEGAGWINLLVGVAALFLLVAATDFLLTKLFGQPTEGWWNRKFDF